MEPTHPRHIQHCRSQPTPLPFFPTQTPTIHHPIQPQFVTVLPRCLFLAQDCLGVGDCAIAVASQRPFHNVPTLCIFALRSHVPLSMVCSAAYRASQKYLTVYPDISGGTKRREQQQKYQTVGEGTCEKIVIDLPESGVQYQKTFQKNLETTTNSPFLFGGIRG